MNHLKTIMAGFLSVFFLGAGLCQAGSEQIGGDSKALQDHSLGKEAPLSDNASVKGGLTLKQALSMTKEYNSELAGSAAEVEAKTAKIIQADLLPNPEISAEIENFGGQDNLRGFDNAETTLSLSQRLELGGKRGKRQTVAQLDKGLAQWDLKSKQSEVLSLAAQSYMQVLAEQEQLVQAESLERLAGQMHSAVASRVASGKAPPPEEIRARVELANVRMATTKIREKLNLSRQHLSSFWGESAPHFIKAIGNIKTIPDLPDEKVIESRIIENPDVARWSTEINQRRATLDLTKSQAIPDVTVSFGIRNYRENGNNAMTAGFSIPVPLFDRNQGEIGEAQANVEKAKHQQQAASIEARKALASAWKDLIAARTEALTLRDDVIPGTVAAYDAVSSGYREGKFDFLSMLEAQRSLFEAQGQSLQAFLSMHQARIEVARLLGMALDDILAPSPTTAKGEITL